MRMAALILLTEEERLVLNLKSQYRLEAYHGVADEYDASWNLEGLNQSIDVIFNISNELANSSQWPNWYEGNEFKATRDAARAGK